jgi:AAA15 family ATPase/GTPase
MELLFLWIENFRGIEKQPFNFSSLLNFTVKVSNDSTELRPSYIIEVNRNHEFISLFSDNILNITGIIGRNGTGKSSLLHCLKLMTGQLARLTSPLIFSILDRKKNQILTYYYSNGGVKEMLPLNVSIVVLDHTLNNQFDISGAKPYSINRLQGEKGTISGLDFDFKDISTCFYSNSFDSHREVIYDGIINLSSNYKIDEFLKTYVRREIEKEKRKKKAVEREITLWPSHIAEFHKLEVRSMLRFLAYANRRKAGLIPDLPKSVLVNFNFDDYDLIVNKGSLEHPLSDIIKKIHEQSSKIIFQQKSEIDRFYNLILLCTLYYYVRWHIENRRSSILENQIPALENLSNQFSFENLQSILVEIPKLSTISGINVMRHVISDQFLKSLKKVEIISDRGSDQKSRFEFKINNALWPVLSAVYNLSYVDAITFIDYEWNGGLSTGEEAYLRHFSRLNDIRPKIKGDTLWLLIDEGDLYFHPQWQKAYLDSLLTYVSFLFHNRKVQIILTTHSPFIASDLPKQNLIFLTKDGHNCKVADENVQSETFGANIHELFSNSFFIHNGLMGDFAKGKINEAIEWCNSKERFSRKEVEYYKSLVRIIGEPLIRYKLLEMIAAKIGDNTETARLRSQRDEINRRLKEIENDSNKE